MLILADIAIVVSILLLMWGASSESLWGGQDEAWFIDDKLLLFKVNLVGMLLFVLGLCFQDYPSSIESDFKILFQVVTAFARVFGFV